MLTEVNIMLTDRQLLILQVIIDEFIETAQPVGSRSLSGKEDLPYSAATIRNEMADLEKMDFLKKTHSSSGRVPSEKGYRYYVDYLIVPEIKKNDMKKINNIIHKGFFEMEQMIQTSAEMLSELTNYTAIALGPEMFETKLRQMQIVSLSAHSAVAILITNTGHVEHRSFTIPEEMNSSDLEKMVNILNDRLKGIPIIELHNVFNMEIVNLLKMYIYDFDRTYDYLYNIFFNEDNENPVKLYIKGKSNILMQPEFNDVDKIRAFYTMMDNEDALANLLKNTKQGIRVKIGKENKIEAINDLSLITASYHLDKGQGGAIALLGPTRMEYGRAIALMESLSKELNKLLHNWNENGN